MLKKFPEYLHRPFQILWWETDELGLYTIALIIGLVFEHIIAWIIPVLLAIQYSKYKKRYPRGFIKHLLYFVGLIKFQNYPDYWIDKFNE